MNILEKYIYIYVGINLQFSVKYSISWKQIFTTVITCIIIFKQIWMPVCTCMHFFIACKNNPVF